MQPDHVERAPSGLQPGEPTEHRARKRAPTGRLVAAQLRTRRPRHNGWVASSSKWLDHQVTHLLAQLSEFGLVIPAEQATVLITERVESAASLMRVTPQTARRYLDPVRLAESLAAALQDELPGVDLLGQPRDTSIPLPLVGRCIAGLAEAITVRICNEAPQTALTNIGNLSGCLSALGQFTADTIDADGDQGVVRVPRAFLRRVIRNLEAAADVVEAGGTLPGELGSYGADGVARLAATFRGDAQMLRIVETAPEGPAEAPTGH